MFFVGLKRRIATDTLYLHLLPTGAVLFTLLILTSLSWRNASQALQKERDTTTASLATHTSNTIVERLRTYEVVLKGAAGLFTASNEVTREEWKQYIGGLDLQQKYPGLMGVGYTAFVRPDQVDGFTQSARRDGLSDFHIFPTGQRPIYAATLYFEPQTNPKGLGFDMYSEPVRREAMVWAQTTGEPVLTHKLAFVIDDGQTGQAGFTMYAPVYTDATQYSRPANERSTRGFIFAPFSTADLFKDVLDQSAKDTYAVRIYDGTPQQNQVLYETDSYAALASRRGSFTTQMPLQLYGREWTLDFRFSPTTISNSTRNRPIGVLVSGITLSFLLSGFVLALLMARTKALTLDKQTEVQSAKDELLSLASHQLRTPATAVKQYLGMLREGYAGKLDKDQQTLLEKAFVSNERQLHIINDLLYVAKIDAKGIVLSLRKLDVGKLVSDVVQEVSDAAKEKKKKIRLQLPKRKVYAEADEHCLSMAVENIVMNAIRYSYESAPVTVKVSNHKQEVRIAVKDRGVGIAPEDIPLLFQQFTRIPNDLTKQSSGSGIGLYLSQQLIKLHGGTIEVESEKGKGSTFTIHLPKKQANTKS